MATEKKVVVLKAGEIESGKSATGREWSRRVLQIWSGEIAGAIRVYDTTEKLNELTAGEYMCEYVERNGDAGNIDITLGNFRPARPAPQPKPNNG